MTVPFKSPIPLHNPQALLSRPIGLRPLFLTIIVLLVAMQACLWVFLVLPLWWLALGLGACLAAAFGIARAPWRGAVSPGTLAACFAVAGLVLVLGGEGRLFYANTDWMVRNAVLALQLHFLPEMRLSGVGLMCAPPA